MILNFHTKQDDDEGSDGKLKLNPSGKAVYQSHVSAKWHCYIYTHSELLQDMPY